MVSDLHGRPAVEVMGESALERGPGTQAKGRGVGVAGMRAPLSETELATTVLAELQRFGYETYEEVYAGNRADIVAVQGPVLAVVECKVSLSLKFLDQLLEWRGQANHIIAAYAGGRYNGAFDFVCRSAGIGVWEVRGAQHIVIRCHPRLFRKTGSRLRRALSPQNRSGAGVSAGTNGGGYHTPFRETCQTLRAIVARHPDGILLRDALTQFNHHYSSNKVAMSSLPKLIRSGVIKGIREDLATPLKLYPAPIEVASS